LPKGIGIVALLKKKLAAKLLYQLTKLAANGYHVSIAQNDRYLINDVPANFPSAKAG